jgi:hypothetical protein
MDRRTDTQRARASWCLLTVQVRARNVLKEGACKLYRSVRGMFRKKKKERRKKQKKEHFWIRHAY